MHEFPLLDELALITVVGVVITTLLARVKLPPAAGLLACGALIGPSGLALVENTEAIETLAEVGVVLLLFSIGLELPLASLKRVASTILIGGSLQVGLTILAALALASLFEVGTESALFYGFVLSLSSTAIVLEVLSGRGELEAPHGRFIVGALLFQDLSVVPMMLVLETFGVPGAGIQTVAIAAAIGKALLVVGAILAFSRLVVPQVILFVDKSRSRQLFQLAIISMCIGTAWLTYRAGLSLALGAFLGGIVVAGTEYRHRALSDIIPLRDVFASIFFISLGMLFDAEILESAPGLVALLLAAFLFGKGALATLAALAMRFPARVAWLAGVGLAQFGEFGYVLAIVAREAGVIDSRELAALLSAGVITMFLTPVLVRVAPRVTAGEILLRPLEQLLGAKGAYALETEQAGLRDHVVIAGYGVAGESLSRALEELSVPHVVLELNAESVRRARREKKPVYHADASRPEPLEHAKVSAARAVVLLINDSEAARRSIAAIRNLSGSVPIVVRTRYVADRPLLASLGATHVVVEEIASGIEIREKTLEILEKGVNSACADGDPVSSDRRSEPA